MSNEIEDIKILSLDGGGVRGLATVSFLKHVEDYLLKTENKTLYEYFDGFVGVSSGGVLALCLASGMSIDQVANLVSKYNTDRIFTETSFYDVYNSKYTDEKREVFKEELDKIGVTNKFLADNDKLCAVTAYGLTDRRAHIFSSLDSDKVDSHISFLDAADSTSAAPSYFPSVKTTIDGKEGYFIDGGVISRQPSMVGYSIAKLAYPDIDSGHIKIFSVGAGNNDSKPILGAGSQNKFAWLPYIADILNDPSIDDFYSKSILGDNFLRINSSTDFEFNDEKASVVYSIGDHSQHNLDNLNHLGDLWWEAYHTQVESFLV